MQLIQSTDIEEQGQNNKERSWKKNKRKFVTKCENLARQFIKRYKARFVVNGIAQKRDIDFDEIFFSYCKKDFN